MWVHSQVSIWSDITGREAIASEGGGDSSENGLMQSEEERTFFWAPIQ